MSALPVPSGVLLFPESESAIRFSPYDTALLHQAGLNPPMFAARRVGVGISESLELLGLGIEPHIIIKQSLHHQ